MFIPPNWQTAVGLQTGPGQNSKDRLNFEEFGIRNPNFHLDLTKEHFQNYLILKSEIEEGRARG